MSITFTTLAGRYTVADGQVDASPADIWPGVDEAWNLVALDGQIMTPAMGVYEQPDLAVDDGAVVTLVRCWVMRSGDWIVSESGEYPEMRGEEVRIGPSTGVETFHLQGQHDQQSHAGGRGDNTGLDYDPRTEIPTKRPGEAEIPEGAVRLSHRTWTSNLDSILENGLEARDAGDGSGVAVWAAAGVGVGGEKPGEPWQAESDIAYIEFWAMPDELGVGNNQDPAWLEERSAHVTMGAMPPERIVGAYVPWHAAYWGFESRATGTFDEVNSGFYDSIGRDHPDTYGKAIDYIKSDEDLSVEMFHLQGQHDQQTHAGDRASSIGEDVSLDDLDGEFVEAPAAEIVGRFKLYDGDAEYETTSGARLYRAEDDRYVTLEEDDSGVYLNVHSDLYDVDVDVSDLEARIEESWREDVSRSIVYHGTRDGETAESIRSNGLQVMSETRGLNNRWVGPAVYTSTEPELAGSYGQLFEVDLPRAIADGVIDPDSLSREPGFNEADAMQAVASSFDDYSFDAYGQFYGSGEDPQTVVINADIPPEYLKFDEDGSGAFSIEVFHLQGQHDQQRHAGRNAAGETIVDVGKTIPEERAADAVLDEWMSTPEEFASARALAAEKALNVPKPTAVQIAKNQAMLAKSKRPGGWGRGNSYTRRARAQALFEEFGGTPGGYCPCGHCGIKVSPRGEGGFAAMTQDKILTAAEGGTYGTVKSGFPNLIPACGGCNASRNQASFDVRPEWEQGELPGLAASAGVTESDQFVAAEATGKPVGWDTWLDVEVGEGTVSGEYITRTVDVWFGAYTQHLIGGETCDPATIRVLRDEFGADVWHPMVVTDPATIVQLHMRGRHDQQAHAGGALPDVPFSDVKIAYRPRHPDGKADPGEVVWAKVPFEERDGRAKDRPVLIIGRTKDGKNLVGVQLTSKPGRDRVAVGTGDWDRQGRQSYMDTTRFIQVDDANYRREGAYMKKPKFQQIADVLTDRQNAPDVDLSVEQFHMAGQHNQMDHGRRGAAGASIAGSVVARVEAGESITVSPSEVADVVAQFADQEGPMDLAAIDVEGYPNLFSGARANVTAREDMPQIPKAHLQQFREELEAEGIAVEEVQLNATELSATQRQLDAVKVAGVADAIRNGEFKVDHRIWVSHDNRILDGHHRWAAAAVVELEGHPASVPLDGYRVDMDMDALLVKARRYNEEHGVDARTYRAHMEALGLNPGQHFHLQGQHDQQSHAGDYQGGHRPSETGPRIHDLLESEMTDGLDVYQNPHFFTGYAKAELDETMAQLRRVQGDPEANVTIYRAAPEGATINEGDWVSLSETYARLHADSGNAGDTPAVVEMEVPAKTVRWAVDDLMEYGYFPDLGEKRIFSEDDLAVDKLISSALAVEMFHLQGQHDQSTHGRRGSSSGIGAQEPLSLVEGLWANPPADLVAALDAYTENSAARSNRTAVVAATAEAMFGDDFYQPGNYDRYVMDDVEGIAEILMTRHRGADHLGYELAHTAEHFGMTADELEASIVQGLTDGLAAAPVSIRVTDEVLSEVLTDDRFMNLYETGQGFGWNDQELRRWGEYRLFGIDPELGYTFDKKVTPQDRPIYGYMDVDGNNGRTMDPTGESVAVSYYGSSELERSANLDQYGGIRVELKDSVRDRTSFTFGDSLGEWARPSPINAPEVRSMGNRYDGFSRIRANQNGMDMDATSDLFWNTGRYVEAQVHGGVAVSDIARVTFPSAPSPQITANLEARGIDWAVVEVVPPGIVAGYPDEPWPPGEEPLAASASAPPGGVVYVDPSGATITKTGAIDGEAQGFITRDGVDYPPAPIIALLAHGYWRPVQRGQTVETFHLQGQHDQQTHAGGRAVDPTSPAARRGWKPLKGVLSDRPIEFDDYENRYRVTAANGQQIEAAVFTGNAETWKILRSPAWKQRIADGLNGVTDGYDLAPTDDMPPHLIVIDELPFGLPEVANQANAFVATRNARGPAPFSTPFSGDQLQGNTVVFNATDSGREMWDLFEERAADIMMPSVSTTSVAHYTGVHEYGHTRAIEDGTPLLTQMYDSIRPQSLSSISPEWKQMSRYGKSNAAEAHAETFADFVLTGGQPTNAATVYYSSILGWGSDAAIEEALAAAAGTKLRDQWVWCIDSPHGGTLITKAPEGADFHLQGQHDQQTHGRRGPGTGVPDEFAQAPNGYRESAQVEWAAGAAYLAENEMPDWWAGLDYISEDGLPVGRNEVGANYDTEDVIEKTEKFREEVGDEVSAGIWMIGRAADARRKEVIAEAISTNQISPEEAKERWGYDADADRGEWQELPQTLYHATSAMGAIAADGSLKTRREIGGRDSAAGLGGGTDNTISFTSDRAIADGIARSLHEAHRALNLPKDTFLTELRERSGSYWADVEEADRSLNGTRSWDTLEERFDLYRSFARVRERQEGILDPLFFNVNPETLRDMNPADIGIVEVMPAVTGAKGYQVSALGEWRTPTGAATEITRFIETDPVDQFTATVEDMRLSAQGMRVFHLQGQHDQQSHAGGRAKTEFEPITAAEARGNSRPVTSEEFQRLAAIGRRQIDELAADTQPIDALDENWTEIQQEAFDAAQASWGGATINARTGEFLASDADRYALTVKESGMETVTVPEGASKAKFETAMTEARNKFRPILERRDHYLGVFHDDDLGRIDFDPVTVVDSLDKVETIGAATRAIGGAYNFADGNGYWPPHVDDELAVAASAGMDGMDEKTSFKGPAEWKRQAKQLEGAPDAAPAPKKKARKFRAADGR
jgi:hypothetical protein